MSASDLAGRTLRLGTRGSALARAQSAGVATALEKFHPGLTVELIICRTQGDAVQDRPLHEFGGKGVFTKELEEALLDGRIDFAVHSLKDVPVTMPLVAQAELVVAAVPEREDARDVLVSPEFRRIADLPTGARVGTGSLRRRAQLLQLRPDLKVEPLRGNVDTRLGKLARGDYDAVILAMAGVRRTGLFDSSNMTPIPTDELLPAAGQGALALQCRRNDAATRALLAVLHDEATAACVRAERSVVAALDGDCHSPIGAYATLDGRTVTLRAAVAEDGGVPPVARAEVRADVDAAAEAVGRVVELLPRRATAVTGCRDRADAVRFVSTAAAAPREFR